MKVKSKLQFKMSKTKVRSGVRSGDCSGLSSRLGSGVRSVLGSGLGSVDCSGVCSRVRSWVCARAEVETVSGSRATTKKGEKRMAESPLSDQMPANGHRRAHSPSLETTSPLLRAPANPSSCIAASAPPPPVPAALHSSRARLRDTDAFGSPGLFPSSSSLPYGPRLTPYQPR